MKYQIKIILILISMFFIAQLIGIFVANAYAPEIVQYTNQTTGLVETEKVYNLPYGFNPPEGTTPGTTVISILIAIAIAVLLIFALMKIRAEIFLRLWFFVVVTIGLSLALNAFFIKIPNSAYIALIIALPFAIIKVFQRNIIVHNFTEMLIYPGIATVFIPLLNVWTVVILLLFISVYDIYAVWHAGFMQKMAKYQIEKVRVFSGFFVPYMSKKDKELLKKSKLSKSKSKKGKKIGVNVAILGGGDVVFPIILAGVVLAAFGVFAAILISIGATIALSILFYYSEKGKFYPAMPFISAGCLVALGVVYWIF